MSPFGCLVHIQSCPGVGVGLERWIEVSVPKDQEKVQSSGLVVTESRAVRLWLALGSTTVVLFMLTVVLISRSVGVAEFDEDVTASMSTLRHPVLTSIAQIITDLGSYRPVAVVSFVLAVVVGYRTRRLLEPVVLLAAVEVGTSLVELLKVATGRARPPTEGVLGAPVFDYSFPSGHTASGTVLYVLAALLLALTETQNSTRRLLIVAGSVVGCLIGWSRVYLGYHWFTDVVGAWLLAAAVTSIAMAFVSANQRPDWDPPLRDALDSPSAFSRLTSLVIGDRPAQTIGAH
jgi:undecaprenyl-diphosphatase